MEGIVKVAFLFLVLMIVGTGFVFAQAVTALTSYRNFCIRSLLTY